MSNFESIPLIVAALAPGVVSPGPSALLVVRSALSCSRPVAFAVANGIALGGVALAAGGLLGLHLLLARYPALDAVLRIAGAAYLACLGAKMWKHAAAPAGAAAAIAAPTTHVGRALLDGLVMQVSNVKGMVIYASVFSAFLPHRFDGAYAATLLLCVFLLESSWYSGVAMALTRERLQQAYWRSKRRIDRIAGTAMLLIAGKLLSTLG